MNPETRNMKHLLFLPLLLASIQAYFQILEQVNQTGQIIPINDSILIQDLQNLSENDIDLPGSCARNLLIAYGLIDYSEPIEFPDTSVAAPSLPILNKKKDQGKASNSNESFIRVFPNPAKDYVIIEFLIAPKEPNSSVAIEINDASGILIEKIVTSKIYDQVLFKTSKLNKGIYLCVLKVNNQVIASNKFIISR
jgi:hypothetical protein